MSVPPQFSKIPVGCWNGSIFIVALMNKYLLMLPECNLFLTCHLLGNVCTQFIILCGLLQ